MALGAAEVGTERSDMHHGAEAEAGGGDDALEHPDAEVIVRTGTGPEHMDVSVSPAAPVAMEVTVNVPSDDGSDVVNASTEEYLERDGSDMVSENESMVTSAGPSEMDDDGSATTMEQ